jgi:hypothetical protein
LKEALADRTIVIGLTKDCNPRGIGIEVNPMFVAQMRLAFLPGSIALLASSHG